MVPTSYALVGGEDATSPSFASLKYVYGGDESGLCGATIIHELYVLTAAHCANINRTDTKILVYFNDMSSQYVLDIYFHPKHIGDPIHT